jgi:hypothetical protein
LIENDFGFGKSALQVVQKLRTIIADKEGNNAMRALGDRDYP